jgi:hypothetical protein
VCLYGCMQLKEGFMGMIRFSKYGFGRNLVIMIMALSVLAFSAHERSAFAVAAPPSGGATTGGSVGTPDPDPGLGSLVGDLFGSVGSAIGGVASSFFGDPMTAGIGATTNSAGGLFDAFSAASLADLITDPDVIAAGIMGAFTGVYDIPVDFGNDAKGNAQSGGFIYDSNNDSYALTVPDGSGGTLVVANINDALQLGLDLGSFGSIMANGAGAIINFGPFTFNIGDFVSGLFGDVGFCGQQAVGGLGQVICNVHSAMSGLPRVLEVFAYISAMLMAVTGTLKMVEHVSDPRSVPVWEPVKRYLAGGFLFALPYTIEVLVNGVSTGLGTIGNSNGMAGNISGGGLDAMLVRLMSDIWSPMLLSITWFSYMAAFIFMLIGIHRLLKSAQDGPRGPAGIGTIMTFIVAGALFSIDSMLAAFSGSMFSAVAGGANVHTYGALAQTTGDINVDNHVAATIGVGVAFMVIVGWISFVRGFFIIRGVAEGDQQASLMAGVTHLLGGALAVNIGPVIEAVQSTLGLSADGLNFT